MMLPIAQEEAAASNPLARAWDWNSPACRAAGGVRVRKVKTDGLEFLFAGSPTRVERDVEEQLNLFEGEYPATERDRHGLGSVARPELEHDAVDITLDGPLGRAQVPGDLLILVAARNERQNLHLAGCQDHAVHALGKPARDGRRDVALPGVDAKDRADDLLRRRIF